MNRVCSVGFQMIHSFGELGRTEEGKRGIYVGRKKRGAKGRIQAHPNELHTRDISTVSYYNRLAMVDSYHLLMCSHLTRHRSQASITANITFPSSQEQT